MIYKILLPLILFISFSCQKDDPSQSTNSAPQISISSPLNNSQYTEPETISIQASISDDKDLNEVSVQLQKISDNTISSLFHLPHIHKTNYALHFNYNVKNSDIGNHKIIVKATDWDGNQTVQTIDMVLNP